MSNKPTKHAGNIVKRETLISYNDIKGKKNVPKAPPRTLEDAVEEEQKMLKQELDYEMAKAKKRETQYKNTEPVIIDSSANKFKNDHTVTSDIVYINDDGEMEEIKQKPVQQVKNTTQSKPVSQQKSAYQPISKPVQQDDDKFVFDPKGKVTIIRNKLDYDRVIKNPKVIIFYGATYCNVCNDLKDLYQRIATRYGHLMKMAYTDVDLIGMNLNPVPQIVTYTNGEQRALLEGAVVEQFRAIIKDLLELKL